MIASQAPAPREASAPGAARAAGARAARAARAAPAAVAVPAPRAARAALRGILWAALLVAATAAGDVAVAVLLVPASLVAAVSTVRACTRPGGGARPPGASLALAASLSVVLPVAALGGLTTAAFGAAVGVGAAAALLLVTPLRFPLRALLASVAPPVAAASLVVARHQGVTEALTLVAALCLFDLASFTVGGGPRGGLPGAVGGVLTLAVLAVLVAAGLVPPFEGRSPWILLGLVAALAPAGVAGGWRLSSQALPALRRLDSALLAAPAWVIGVSLLLHR